ncbi:MAG: hypothetical protein IPL01_24325 [Acidobacteria bacterium]|nr:hypothetical protein [Acidobacteriota bacterium]
MAVTGFYDSLGTLEINRELLENRIGYDPSFLHYHKGWFQDTLPAESSQVGDSSSQTRRRLVRIDQGLPRHLCSKSRPGGFIIIDDYGCYEGCKRAVDEFLESQYPPLSASHRQRGQVLDQGLMRILHFSDKDTDGGAAKAAHRLHCALRDAGQQSKMVVFRKTSMDPDVRQIQPPIPLRSTGL